MNTVRSGEAADGPEHASSPPSRETARWAAILCFIAAFMCLVGIGWSMYARRATDDSFGRLGGHLPPDATSALAALDTLNMVVAVLNAILAVALVVGGIMLLRRKPAGRIVVAVAGTFLLLAPVVTYVLSTQIWSRLVAAMSHVSDVEVMRFGPGVGTVIRGVLVALVMLGLVLAPSTKRWLTYQGQPYGQGQLAAVPGSVLDPSLPPPTRGTTLGAAVLSLLGGAVFLFLAVAGVVEALDSDEGESSRIVAGVGAAVTAPLAAGLIVGSILLFRRRLSGRTIVVVTWAVVILLATGLLSAVTALDHRRPEAFGRILAVVAPTVGCAAAAIVLAVVSSTRRWCEARTGLTNLPAPTPLTTGWAAEQHAAADMAASATPTADRPNPIETPLDSVDRTPAPVAGGTARGKQAWLVFGAVVAAVLLVMATVLVVRATSGVPGNGTQSQKPVALSYGDPIVLPFPDNWWGAQDVAVDSAGTVYVTDPNEKQVWASPTGSNGATLLPFTGIDRPIGVAVDPAGTVYIGDNGSQRGLAFPTGSSSPTTVLKRANQDVAVDAAGTAYFNVGTKVVAVKAGSDTQTEFDFHTTLINSVAVDANGTVYAAGSKLDGPDKNAREHRVASLAAGAATPTELPFTGLEDPGGIAVDANGTVYVADTWNNRVLALPAGATAQTVLPIPGMRLPKGVATDRAGNVYITGYYETKHGNRPVIELPLR